MELGGRQPSREGENVRLQYMRCHMLVDDTPEVEEAREGETRGLRLIAVNAVFEAEAAQHPPDLEDRVAAVQGWKHIPFPAGIPVHTVDDRGMTPVRDQSRGE